MGDLLLGKAEPVPLTPPDLERCQAEIPTAGPFQMGGIPGDPANGYRRRCAAPPTVIATERKPGADGRIGSMSLCESCQGAFIQHLGTLHADFEPVPE